ISKNLKLMGLDIDAAPTSFDTIVAKAFSAPVSFDIYVLGFSLGDFPETYICDFFCTNRDVNLGTGGSTSAGYSNATADTPSSPRAPGPPRPVVICPWPCRCRTRCTHARSHPVTSSPLKARPRQAARQSP